MQRCQQLEWSALGECELLAAGGEHVDTHEVVGWARGLLRSHISLRNPHGIYEYGI